MVLYCGGLLMGLGGGRLCRSCCSGPKVLIWDDDTVFLWYGVTGNSTHQVENIYTNLGVTVHYSGAYSGNISDYKLILWPLAASNPVWWGDVTSGNWTGRIHLTAEYYNAADPSGAPQNAVTVGYCNSISSVTGISIVAAVLDGGCSWASPVYSDALTEGMDSIYHAASSYTSGGTVLADTVQSPGPWLAHNVAGTVDWVVAADANHMTDFCNIAARYNQRFWENLWNTAI